MPVRLTVAGACSGNRRLSSGCVSTTNILNCVACPVESRLTDVAKPTRVTLPEFWSSASSALTCLATILPFESSLASTSTKVLAAKALSPEMSSNFVLLVILMVSVFWPRASTKLPMKAELLLVVVTLWTVPLRSSSSSSFSSPVAVGVRLHRFQ